MNRIITNIKGLVNAREEVKLLRGADLANLPVIENAWIVIEDGIIHSYGSMNDLPKVPSHYSDHYNAEGRYVLPSWCDSHTHLVFAGSRENEFVDKIKGLSYSEIAAKGGGILASAKRLQDTSEDELFRQSYQRLQEVIKMGTGSIEIKSGYGLTAESELKMLRVIRRLKEAVSIPVKSTFLGAHTYPLAYKENHEGYIDILINEILPVIKRDHLADYIDVFIEDGFFSPGEAERICKSGKEAGLKTKLHANQLSLSGGVELGAKIGAVSVDHLETMDDHAIQALAQSDTIGTLLPTAAFFLRMPLQPARVLIDRNCAIALASDYNPGSSPSGNMNFVFALSCIGMKLLPEEAINAATINGAYAMEVDDTVGSISRGKKANLIITQAIPSLAYLPYSFGNNLIEKVMVAGEWIS